MNKGFKEFFEIGGLIVVSVFLAGIVVALTMRVMAFIIRF